jgi:ribosomal protein L24E
MVAKNNIILSVFIVKRHWIYWRPGVYPMTGLWAIAGNGKLLYISSYSKCPRFKKCTFCGSNMEKLNGIFLRSADIMVLPTYSENFGIGSRSFGVRCTSNTTTGTPWKIWKPYECGWWIDLSKENLAKTLGMAMQKTTEDLETMGKTVLN